MDSKIIFISIFMFGILGLACALPTGPNTIDFDSNETWTGNTAGEMVNISGGYLAKMEINATVQNRNWKAMLGQVNGKFVLNDAGGSTIYDWNLASISGQVYASRANNVDWTNAGFGCASGANIAAEDTALEHTGGDNIAATFSGTNLETYSVAGNSIGVGACSAINTYVNNASQTNSFEEIVLWDSSNAIFATEIHDDVAGYDGADYDFQILVPQNGNEAVTANTAYYLYVELNA